MIAYELIGIIDTFYTDKTEFFTESVATLFSKLDIIEYIWDNFKFNEETYLMNYSPENLRTCYMIADGDKD